jgi:uncharacterized membrane protein
VSGDTFSCTVFDFLILLAVGGLALRKKRERERDREGREWERRERERKKERRGRKVKYNAHHLTSEDVGNWTIKV